MPSRLSARCRAAPYNSIETERLRKAHCVFRRRSVSTELHGLEFYVVIVIFCFVQSVGNSVASGE